MPCDVSIMFTFQNGIEKEVCNDTEVGHRNRLFKSGEGVLLGATLENSCLQKKVYYGAPDDNGDKVNIYSQWN